MNKTNTLKTIQSIVIIALLAISTSLSSQTLVNPNANKETVQLKTFLDSIYGKKILSGQAFEGIGEQWLNIISKASGGQQPAILSLDFMNSMPWRVSKGADPDTVTKVAIDWAKNKGGIVEMHWHWDAPKDTDFDTWQGFYSKNTTFDLPYALSDTATEEYKLLIRDMDIVANLLKKMQDSSVAVLWRPLHEAEGTWFWWGNNGGNVCKELWHIMYDRFVNLHGLNNLIWVWNSYGTTKENWYPGDDEVDIIAWDYPDYNQNTGSWSQYEKLFGDKGKLFALGEDGKLIDPDVWENQKWLYFITWAYMIKDPSMQNGKNTAEWINKVYNDPRVLTLDDLKPGPKAKAGSSQLIFDFDGDGAESVQLDGSASYTDSGTVAAYHWSESGAEIAVGVKPEVTLNIGEHNIKLVVTTSIGEKDSSNVVITIKTPSLSLNKEYSTSSTEAGLGNEAINAIDGDMETRWSSLYADPQWYQIDLGSPHDISNVTIHWEVAAAKEYRIDQSNDGNTWYTVAHKIDMPMGDRTDVIDELSGGARYIRMYGISRASTYGYSIYEFEVYGTENANAQPDGELITSNKTNEISTFNVYPSILEKGEVLFIKGAFENTNSVVRIYDITGKVIFNQKLNGNNESITIDSKFNSGVYVLNITSLNESLTKRIVVK